tara:strand:- start:587 stop:1762 length:1176 start_codon:yes stop_codon:yes gene_type:complete
MSIILRSGKGSALTYDELDGNLEQFYISSSLSSNNRVLSLFTSGGEDQITFRPDDTLQTITDIGNTTTNSITALSFIKSGSTSSDVLLGDGTTTPISGLGGGVTKVGTPVDGQITVWTGDGTVEGTTELLFNSASSTLTIAGAGVDDTVTILVAGGDGISISDGSGTVSTTYSVLANSYIKSGSTSNDILLGDGTTSPLSSITGSLVYSTGSIDGSTQSVFGGNITNGGLSTIAGGASNSILGSQSFIGAGKANQVTGSNAAILAGSGSIAKGDRSAILAGQRHTIDAGGLDAAIVAGNGNYIGFLGSSILSGDNITAARKYTAHATSVYVTGSTAELAADYGGVLQLARRETTPQLSGDYEGMIINSGSAARSDLYFYSGTNDGWVKITV